MHSRTVPTLGYGGLGRYLIDGIARRDFDRLFAGVVLVAGLALLTEFAIALVQRRLTSAGLRAGAGQKDVAFTKAADLPASAAGYFPDSPGGGTARLRGRTRGTSKIGKPLPTPARWLLRAPA